MEIREPKRWTCSICKERCMGFGNNPWPYEGERCCNECNDDWVIPARLARINPKHEKGGPQEVKE